MKIITENGPVNFEHVDKTLPNALHDYECSWGHDKPHTIKKGDRYVRVVYKVNGQFEMQHVCFQCWFA